MSKKLILLRHGEANFPTRNEKDKDRKLTKTGQNDVKAQADFFNKKNISIDGIFSSSSERTRMTTKIITDHLNYNNAKIEYSDKLYETSVSNLLTYISNINNKYNSILIVGHNPTLSYFTEYLSSQHSISLSPATSVYFEFEFDDWQMITKNSGKLHWVQRPSFY